MKPSVRTLVLIALSLVISFVLFSYWAVAATDCGCGGLPDASPPSGWDNPDATIDDSGSLSSGTGSGSTGDSSSSASPGSGTGSSSDSGSSSGSGSAGSGGGAPGDSSYDSAVTWRKKAETEFAAGNLTASLDAYKVSLRIDPYSTKAWAGKGDVLAAAGNYTEALQAYDRAIKLDQGDADIWNKKGGIFLMQGDYNASIASFDKALALNPNLLDARENRTIAQDFSSGIHRVAPVNTTPVSPTEVPALPATVTEQTTAARRAPVPPVLPVIGTVLAAWFAVAQTGRTKRE